MKGNIIHAGPVYICDNCHALINPIVYEDSVHAHGNEIIPPGKCTDFYCNNRIVTYRYYDCPSCDKHIDLPPDPEAENLKR